MKSVFFRRMVYVMVLVMLIFSAVMAAGYGVLSSNMYVSMKLEEMGPKAETLADLVAERQRGEISYDAFVRMVSSYVQSSNAATVIFNSDGQTVLVNNFPQDVAVSDVTLCEQFKGYYCQILEGNKVSDPGLMIEGLGVMLLSGVPITDDAGEPIGGVIIMQRAQAVTEGLRPIRVSLYLCILTGVVMMFMIMTWRLSRETDPLHKMSEAAIEMSKGNFDVRANENESGETGLLARALNNLCETLSSTIYQLRFEKSQLDQVLQSLSDGVVAMDGSGELTHYNPALMRMLGVVNVEKREDLINDPMIWKAFEEVFLTGESQAITYPMTGDKVIWITVSPVNTEDGARTGVVGLFKDMTEMERTENMRREYVANVSHELRTPLTAVRGLLEPLADGMVTKEEDRQRYYKIMLHEVMRLSRLITDMLTLSRLQAGTEYMELARVDLLELISDVAMGYASSAQQKGIKLEMDCAEVSDALTDADRIEQVLVILLDNAMRYTPEGGVIKIKLRSGEKLIVSVEDSGCGIPEKDLPHVFERFYKVDKSRGEGGTGLGLSIANYIMEKLGESITVASELGKGTCFTFTVKRYVSNAIELGPPDETRKQPSSGKAGQVQEPVSTADGAYDADYEVVPQPSQPAKPKRAKSIKIPEIKKTPEIKRLPEIKKIPEIRKKHKDK